MKQFLFLSLLFVSVVVHGQGKPSTMQFQKLAGYNTAKSFTDETGKDSLTIPYIKLVRVWMKQIARDSALAHSGSTQTLQQVFNVGGGGKAFLSKSDTVSGGTTNNFIIDSALQVKIKAQTVTLSSQDATSTLAVANTGSAVMTSTMIGLYGSLTTSDNTFSSSFTLTNTSLPYYYITLNTPSANSTITIPSQFQSGATNYRILNRTQLSSTFTWAFTGGTLQDAFGNSVTTFPAGYMYEIAQQSASVWVIKNISYVGLGRTGIPIAGSFSTTGSATTTFTVTTGVTEPNTSYKVNVTPTSILSSALFYVNNKTATTFDVVYLSGLTGTVSFDWVLTP